MVNAAEPQETGSHSEYGSDLRMRVLEPTVRVTLYIAMRFKRSSRVVRSSGPNCWNI